MVHYVGFHTKKIKFGHHKHSILNIFQTMKIIKPFLVKLLIFQISYSVSCVVNNHTFCYIFMTNNVQITFIIQYSFVFSLYFYIENKNQILTLLIFRVLSRAYAAGIFSAQRGKIPAGIFSGSQLSPLEKMPPKKHLISKGINLPSSAFQKKTISIPMKPCL